MYQNFYNLKAKPFQISADPRFLWLGEKHREALAVLRYGIQDNKGFLLLTGEVGTGKTTLIHALMNALESEVIIANVPDPGLEPMEFYGFIAGAFHLNNGFKTKYEFLSLFSTFLNRAYDERKQVLLIIDEAQRMSQELLEEIRLLSNIEKQSTKLINIFFVGQAEFNDIILQEKNRALRQRITVNYNLGALTQKETGSYVRHRLKIAGTEAPIFKPGAIKEIHAFSQGYPRLINVICDRALVTGFTDDAATISARVIRECAAEMRLQRHAGKKPATKTKKNRQRAPGEKESGDGRSTKPWLYVLLGVLIAVWIGIAYYMLSPDKARQVLESFLKRESPPAAIQPQTTGVETRETAANVEISEKGSKTEAKAANSPKTEASAKKYQFVFDRDVVLRVTFNSGNDISREGLATLDKLATVMTGEPGLGAVVKGFTKGFGSYQYNRKMAEFSANIVKGYLVGKGIAPARIQTEGMRPEESDKASLATVGDGERQWVEISIEK